MEKVKRNIWLSQFYPILQPSFNAMLPHGDCEDRDRGLSWWIVVHVFM